MLLLAPTTLLCATVQEYVVPPTALVKLMVGFVPEQIVCAKGVVTTTGIGFTVATTFNGFPAQPFAVGVTT